MMGATTGASRSAKRRAGLLFAAGFLVVVAFVACGGDEEGDGATGSGSGAASGEFVPGEAPPMPPLPPGANNVPPPPPPDEPDPPADAGKTDTGADSGGSDAPAG